MSVVMDTFSARGRETVQNVGDDANAPHVHFLVVSLGVEHLRS